MPGPPQRDARPPQTGVADRAPEFLTFSLGAEYGIDVQKVQEIRRYEAPTRIPNAPAWISGVMPLRGAVVPIVDLRARLGMDALAYGASTVTIVVDVDGASTGLVVDAVHDVARIDRDDIRMSGAQLDRLQADYLAGIATVRAADAERTLALLDIDRLMRASSACRPN
jgi:purine-binding chemotaxis protein CheW